MNIRYIVQSKLKGVSEGPTMILKRLFIDNYPVWFNQRSGAMKNNAVYVKVFTKNITEELRRK